MCAKKQCEASWTFIMKSVKSQLSSFLLTWVKAEDNILFYLVKQPVFYTSALCKYIGSNNNQIQFLRSAVPSKSISKLVKVEQKRPYNTNNTGNKLYFMLKKISKYI